MFEGYRFQSVFIFLSQKGISGWLGRKKLQTFDSHTRTRLAWLMKVRLQFRVVGFFGIKDLGLREVL